MSNKKLMGLLFVIVIVIMIIFVIFVYINIYKVDIVLNNNLQVEFNEKRKISSFIKKINGKIIDDKYVDTLSLGSKAIVFNYINDNNVKVSSSFEYEVVDTTPPLILLNSKYDVLVDDTLDLTNSILCGDNYDNKPKCYIDGNYDLHVPGKYDLSYNAVDSSGNSSVVNFTLNVYEKNNKSITEMSTTDYTDIVKKYKSNKTKIGIDISKWQKDIDFSKIKESGVEFVIIRVGGTRGINGEYFLDESFLKNISEAKKYDIPVGLYFYSYANSKKQAKKDAEWLLEQIADYDIELPIAYDFEDWDNFNNYNVSFFELTEIAKTFMNRIKAAGYEPILYSSKNYLERIWLDTGHKTWLAHYSNETDYKGDYFIWQLCNNGRVNGIEGNVDINIMYLK